MEVNPNPGQVRDCKEVWKNRIKKNVRRARAFSALKFFLLIIAMILAILLVITLSLEESNAGIVPTLPFWLRILGVALIVLLMFRGEVWPSGVLTVLYKDVKSGHRFYPKITLKLIEEGNHSDVVKKKLKEIVNRYRHNFANPNLTDPGYFLDEMTQQLCQQIEPDVESVGLESR
jgi:predicted nucleic acid-binding Zn ribbon protein